MSTEEPLQPLLDLSSLEAKKKTFRKLLQATIFLSLVDLVCLLAFPLPDGLQIATDFEAELVPAFRSNASTLVGLGLFGVWVWGIVDLWHFRAVGLTKVAIMAFFPLFLVDNTASAHTAIVGYVAGLECLLDGMLLFMGWANPNMFSSNNGGASPQVNSHANSARDTT